MRDLISSVDACPGSQVAIEGVLIVNDLRYPDNGNERVSQGALLDASYDDFGAILNDEFVIDKLILLEGIQMTPTLFDNGVFDIMTGQIYSYVLQAVIVGTIYKVTITSHGVTVAHMNKVRSLDVYTIQDEGYIPTHIEVS